jgi:C_GCAxxG_C_C family probable redox protein
MTDNPGDAAVQCFKEGLFCAESVLLTLAQRQGVDDPNVPAIATGFCSGLSQTAGPCGAVTGAVMGIGLALGRKEASGSVNQSYNATKALVNRFTEEFGSVNCADLLGCHLGTPEGQQTFTEGKLWKRCMAYTGRATDLAAEIIATAKQP